MPARRSSLRTALVGGLLAMAASAFTFPGEAPGEAPGAMVDVIVRPATSVAAASHDIARLGGEVESAYDAMGLVTGRIPEGRLAELAADRDVAGVTADAAAAFMPDSALTARTPADLDLVARTLRVDDFHDRGFDGAGIDVALVDTGITEVPGLTGKVALGIDLSFDAGQPDFANRDGFGHGTHLAGIIAANSAEVRGMAPGARLINVKVGDRRGAADVSQVIAGIDWVIRNAQTGGRNIRVMTLAFSTASTQSYTIDPLAYAVEAAWRNGIVVVVSGGNGGATTKGLVNPATHPIVIAVGASDTNGTALRGDDTIAAFSQRGTAERSVDVVAPGRSILSTIPTDSYLAQAHPEAFRGSLFLGSGTSQAAAVTSGAIAVLLQHRPEMTPADVKFALRKGADSVVVGTERDGRGQFDLRDARKHSAPGGQDVTSADGSGSLEASRGGHHVELVMDDGSIATLEGEVDFTGTRWTGEAWAGGDWAGSYWSGDRTWHGSDWTGSNWTGSNWTRSNWTGDNWTGDNWTGESWTGGRWSGNNWTGSIWGR